MTLLPGSQRADRYAALKKFCYVERGCLNQCVLTKTLSNEKRLLACVQKIALQINCKLGGELWGTRIPIPLLMSVGVDVYRNKGGARGSVSAVVCSLNASFSKFYSDVIFEDESRGAATAAAAGGTPKSFETDLAMVVRKASVAFAKENDGKFPEKVRNSLPINDFIKCC